MCHLANAHSVTGPAGRIYRTSFSDVWRDRSHRPAKQLSMTYNSLVRTIPNEWKIKIKEKSVNMTDRLIDDIRLTCNNVLVSLEKIT